MKVAIVVDVPDHWGEPSDPTGFSSEGYDGMMADLRGFHVVAGPTPVRDDIDETDLELMK